jgi:hypothetical protein
MTDGQGCTATTSVNVYCSTLPVGLLSYSGKNIAAGNKLDWITATEMKNNHFTIQRSTDGYSYSDFKRIPTQAINGNSSSNLYYSIIDADVKPGKYYYKLSQTDVDGATQELGVVSISVKTKIETLSVKPNPAGNIAEVTYECQSDETALIKLYSDKGIILQSIKASCMKGENSFSIDLSDKPDGIYLISVTSGNDVQYARLMHSH